MKTICKIIDTLEKYKEREAIIFFKEKKIEKYTYHELRHDIERLAHGLDMSDINKGDHVAIISPNRYEMIVTIFAVIYVGGVVVPVDAQADDETIAYILKNSEAKIVMTTLEIAEKIRSKVDDITIYVYSDDDEKNDEQYKLWKTLLKDKGKRKTNIQAHEHAIMLYTSGTTGKPKGVPLAHKQITFQIEQIEKKGLIDSNSILLLPLPLHHVYPLVMGLATPIALGSKVVFPQYMTGQEIIRALKESGVKVIIGVPRLYRALIEGVEKRIKNKSLILHAFFKLNVALSGCVYKIFKKRIGKILLKRVHDEIGPSVDMIASGGSSLSEKIHNTLHALGWKVTIGYGLTETAPLVTLNMPEESRIGSVGKPLEGVELKVLKNDKEKEGEIIVKGQNVFEGYWKLTEEKETPFTDQGWFKTGDRGYIKNDNVYLSGRTSTLIVTESGKNIQPTEIEKLYEGESFVNEMAVLQYNEKNVGIIVTNREKIKKENKKEEVAIHEVVQRVNKKMAPYKRIAEYVITHESLPRTRIGKIRRHLLHDIYESVKKGEKRDKKELHPISISEMSDDDKNLIEHDRAAKMWEWLAEKYKNYRLTPDTDLQLDLEIDSLEWVNLSLEIEERTGISISDESMQRINVVRDLLEEATRQDSSKKNKGLEQLAHKPEEMVNEKDRKWIKPQNLCIKYISWILFYINKIIMRIIFRLKMKGVDNIPESGAYILTPNHTSYIDAFVIAACLKYSRYTQIYWAGAREVAFKNSIFRMFCYLARIIPIEHGRGSLSSLALAITVLKRKNGLSIFPEGRRSHDGKLQNFEPGLEIIARYTKAPLVPVVIKGAYEAWPSSRLFPKPHPIEVLFGKPIEVDSLIGDNKEQSENKKIEKTLKRNMKEL